MCMDALKRTALGFSALLFLGMPSAVFAAGVNVQQALNFGEWAVTNNGSVYNVSIDADGTHTNSPAMVLVGAPPHRGEYEITGLPLLMPVNSIDVVQLDEMAGPGTEGFSLDNFEINYPFGSTTDASGNLVIYLGARANTSASNINYADGVFTGNIELTFNF